MLATVRLDGRDQRRAGLHAVGVVQLLPDEPLEALVVAVPIAQAMQTLAPVLCLLRVWGRRRLGRRGRWRAVVGALSQDRRADADQDQEPYRPEQYLSRAVMRPPWRGTSARSRASR